MKKYELTDITKEVNGKILYQIRALKDFNNVKIGYLGGWMESEKNLSNDGDAWVSDNAQVSGDAKVYGNAWVSGDAWVYGNARVSGNAQVYGNAQLYGDAWVYGNAQVYGDAVIVKSTDYIIIGPIGSRNATLTVTFSNKMIKTGCFYGDLEIFIKEVYEKPEHDICKYEYLAVIELIKKLFETRAK